MAKKKQIKSLNGEGSLRQRSNGSFEYRIVYLDEFDDQKRKSFYGQSDIECREKATEFLLKLKMKKDGIDIDATIPDLLVDKFDYDLRQHFVEEAGYARNISTLKIIERSALAKIPIADITEAQINAFLQSITHYSNSNITKVYRLLKMAYNEAVAKDIITKNIMLSSRLRCPKSKKKTKKVCPLEEDEQAELVAYLTSYKAPNGRNEYVYQLLIAIYSGMRMGEINALKKSDVDLTKGIIHIHSTISRGKDYELQLKEGTKTDAGVRDIPIANALKPILEEAIDKAPKNKYDLIFYDKKNNKLISTNQVNTFYKRACEKCGIEFNGQHSLRHTFATRCIESDISVNVLKKWLGHTNIHITLDTYADVLQRMNNDSINKLDDYIKSLPKAI